MNQRLFNAKKAIEAKLAEFGIEHDITKISEHEDEQPSFYCSTQYGMGIFSDNNLSDILYYILIKEAEKEEDSIYLPVSLKDFVAVLCGRVKTDRFTKAK